MTPRIDDRDFQVWEYQVSHGQLLVRSPRSPSRSTNVDIVFLGVEYMSLPRSLRGGLTVEPATEDDLRGLATPHAGDHAWVLTSGGRRFVVVAGSVTISENDGDIFDSPFEFRSTFVGEASTRSRADARRVTLERATPDRREVLTHLAQLYMHDFSDLLPPERRVTVGDDGRFPEDLHLDHYWSDPDCSVWFLRADGALAGFALLNRHSHCARPVDFNMGEFFVARPHRREGVGMRAAVELIAMHPGQWEIAAGAHNVPAQKFWPAVIAKVAAAAVETLRGDGVAWSGPIMRFVVRPSDRT